MGKTKTKIIDDSIQEEPTSKARGDAQEGSHRPARNEVRTDDGIPERQDPEQEKLSSSGPRAEKKAKVSKRAAKKTLRQAQGKLTHGKKYQEMREKVERTKKYSLTEAIALASKTSYTKFPGSLEAHINTSVKNLRGLVSLPYVSGKKLTVLAFGPSTGSGQVSTEGLEGVIWGSDETIADIEKGPSTSLRVNLSASLKGNSNKEVKLSDIDVIIVTPEWMPKLSKVARILGPRSLMPNPKSGTITENLAKAVTEITGGKTEYKTEPNGMVIHLLVGKVGQAPEEVAANIKALYNTVGKSRVKNITISSTMGPGVKVELSSI